MAVQAQYPSNALLLNRSDKERSNNNINMEYSATLQTQTTPSAFFDQSTNFFSTGGGSSINTRKRGRDSNPTSQQQQQYSSLNLFSLPPQHHQQQYPQVSSSIPSSINASHLRPQWQEQHHQRQEPNSLVSTGLHLSFEECHQTQIQQKQQRQQQTHLLLNVNNDLSTQINIQNDEIDRFLRTQGEQLRRTLAETRRKHYRSLLSAAEDIFSRRLKEKESELDLVGRRNTELEERLASLRAESSVLQAKVRADEASAAALRAQLRHAAEAAAAAAAAAAAVEDRAADDCESACVDPRRELMERGTLGACRRCWTAAANVVVLPCRHLCLCRRCEGVEVCPVCECVRSASVEIYLSWSSAT